MSNHFYVAFLLCSHLRRVLTLLLCSMCCLQSASVYSKSMTTAAGRRYPRRDDSEEHERCFHLSGRAPSRRLTTTRIQRVHGWLYKQNPQVQTERRKPGGDGTIGRRWRRSGCSQWGEYTRVKQWTHDSEIETEKRQKILVLPSMTMWNYQINLIQNKQTKFSKDKDALPTEVFTWMSGRYGVRFGPTVQIVLENGALVQLHGQLCF